MDVASFMAGLVAGFGLAIVIDRVVIPVSERIGDLLALLRHRRHRVR